MSNNKRDMNQAITKKKKEKQKKKKKKNENRKSNMK